MHNYPELKEFADTAVEEVIDGSSEITKNELRNNEHRYELELIKSDEEEQNKLIMKKKGNGRPVPTVTVNAISEIGENLFYRDQRIDNSKKVILNVKEALRIMVEKLDSE